MKKSVNNIDMFNKLSVILVGWILAFSAFGANQIEIKNISRIEGVRENALVGYGLVVGLSGTGDSARSQSTRQSIANTLKSFGVMVDENAINSRNVAAVMVTATMSPYSTEGDLIDVNVSSIGDARNLVGGTLLMTPLKSVDDKVYVIAQGQISVGSYTYDFNGNTVEKNHPTVGVVPSGGRIEKTMTSSYLDQEGKFSIILDDANFSTADKIKKAITEKWGADMALAESPGKITVRIPEGEDPVAFIAQVELLKISVVTPARVIVNERTGTVVAGGNVVIDNVTISHGSIQVVISTEYTASQPDFVWKNSSSVKTVIVPNTEITVDESIANSVTLPEGSSIDDLIKALNQVKTSTRDIIGILQSIKRAGALHAELIIQ